MLVKPGAVFRFIAKGSFALPDADPTVLGGSLALTGSVGSFVQPLAADCWTALGRGTVRGFKCSNQHCKVRVKRKSIEGRCRIDDDDFGPLPEPAPVAVVLGVATTRYCGRCGGIVKGNETKKLERKRCEAPAGCSVAE